MDTVFQISNFLTLPFWALMIAAPRWRWTRRVLRSPLVVAPAALLYAALVLPRALAVFPTIARPQLASVAALLGTPDGATIAWAHVLAFDLFVGRWAYLDSRERGISAWAMAPTLLLTLLLGPLGFLVYLVVRAIDARLRPGAAEGRAALALERNPHVLDNR